MTITGTISIIRQASRTIGADLPPALVAELERLDLTAPEWPGTHRALAEAVTVALLDGKDPAADKRVTAALARHQLATAGVGRAVAQVLDEYRAAAFREHAPALVASWAAVVAEADDAAQTAREQLGNLDLTPEGSRRLTPQQLPVWGKARDLLARADAVEGAWRTLATITDGARNFRPSREAALVFADLDAAALDDAQSKGRTTATKLAEDGHRLDLATLETIGERVARVARERTASAQAWHDDAQQRVAQRLGAGRDIRP